MKYHIIVITYDYKQNVLITKDFICNRIEIRDDNKLAIYLDANNVIPNFLIGCDDILETKIEKD